MGEYQYYEFLAVDKPLGDADRKALRKLSTRARITATKFANFYEWGDFKGDPNELMERWFDLHVHWANWGSRRFMMRLPTRLVDQRLIDAFLSKVDCAELWVSGENLIVDIGVDEMELEEGDGDPDWLAALAPLRAEVLAGDLRLFYLLWLMAVEADAFEVDELEPMPGIGPMSVALVAFAEFFGVDPDLVQAAAERSAVAIPSAATSRDVLKVLSTLTDSEKTKILARLFDGDAHVAVELRAMVRNHMSVEVDAPAGAGRTVGELRARAHAIGLAREQIAAEKLAVERKRRAEEDEKARRVRFAAIVQRGESVWREVEIEIERSNAPGYDKAAELLRDLKAIAEERGEIESFLHRFRAIQERHGRKRRFIERLTGLG